MLHGAIFTSKVVYQLEVVSAIPSAPVVYGFWNAYFLLQLSTTQIKFPLWVISCLDGKDIYLMEQHCPIHSLMVNKVHASVHLLHSPTFLQEFQVLGI